MIAGTDTRLVPLRVSKAAGLNDGAGVSGYMVPAGLAGLR